MSHTTFIILQRDIVDNLITDMKNKLYFLIVGILSFPVFSQCLDGDCINDIGAFKTEKFLYNGYFEKGKIQGFGRKDWNTGEIEVGIWFNGKLVSGSKYKEKCIEGNCYSYTGGSGTLSRTFDNNKTSTIRGDFSQGKLEYGTYTGFDGSIFIGSFGQYGSFNSGEYKKGNVTYNGQFFNDKFNDKSATLLTNETKYEGGFIEGKYYGYGELYINNYNVTLKGNWKGNYMVGNVYSEDYVSPKIIYDKGKFKNLKTLQIISLNSILIRNNSTPTKSVVSSTKTSQNKGIVSKQKTTTTKIQKIPTTRNCECCGIVFKIQNGWGYFSALGDEPIFQFGSVEETSIDYLTGLLSSKFGLESEEKYHPRIIYHSKKCAEDCGN